MGVKDLWKLLEPAGRPVNLESLAGMVLAVDVSIWLNQAVKGMRDRHGNPLSQAHLVVLFNRVCKLLHYRIKPVFVFDGATPALKKQTLTERSRKRVRATHKSLRAMDKQVTKFLQDKILEQVYGKEGGSAPQLTIATPPDMFKLPPLPDNALNKSPEPSSPLRSTARGDHTHQAASLDIHSDDFNSLPPEVQHELLLERQQLETHTHHDPATLPQVAGDFSNYQLSRLMTQSRTTRKLEEVRHALKSNETAMMGLGEESRVHNVETSRILSSEGAHYILVKGDIDSQSSQDEDDEGRGWKEQENEYSGGQREQEASGGQKREDKEELAGGMSSEQFVAEREERLFDSPSQSDSDEEVRGVVRRHKSPRPLSDSPPPPREVHTLSPHTREQESDRGGDVEHSTVHSEQSAPSELTAGISQACRVPHTHTELEQGHTLVMEEHSPVHPKPSPPASTDNSAALSHTHTPDKDSPPHTKPDPVKADSPKMIEADSPAMIEPSPPHTHPPPPTNESSQTTRVQPPHSKTQAVLDASRRHSGNAPSQITPEHSPSPSESSSSENEWTEDLLSLPPSKARARLREEAKELGRESSRQSRAAAAVSSIMYKEAQELLRLFGLPHIVAPSEAEAQCAYLEDSGQVEGTITDDNDVLLFGGRSVYRGLFSQDKDPEVYHSSDVEGKLGLSRQQLVLLAYLLGCDYTAGVEGVGIVSAMELLRDFPGEGLEPLEGLRDWHREALLKPAMVKQASGVLKKLSQSPLPPTFPNEAVYQAYLSPEVDTSSEQFEWGKPDLDLIRQFARDKMSWDQAKVDSLLLPLFKRINSSEQRTITHYLHTSADSAEPQGRGIKSKRIRNVVARLTQKEPAPGNKRERTSPLTTPTKRPRLSHKTRQTKASKASTHPPPPVANISASSSDSD